MILKRRNVDVNREPEGKGLQEILSSMVFGNRHVFGLTAAAFLGLYNILDCEFSAHTLPVSYRPFSGYFSSGDSVKQA